MQTYVSLRLLSTHKIEALRGFYFEAMVFPKTLFP